MVLMRRCLDIFSFCVITEAGDVIFFQNGKNDRCVNKTIRICTCFQGTVEYGGENGNTVLVESVLLRCNVMFLFSSCNTMLELTVTFSPFSNFLRLVFYVI